MKKNCKYFGLCGGCDYLDREYPEQLKLKTQFVKNCLSQQDIDVSVKDCIGTYYPYQYRNKIHLAIGEHKGKVQIGFFQENTKNIIDITDCPLHDKWIVDLITVLKKYITDFKIKPYDSVTRTGVFRYVVARCLDNNLIVTLVCSNQNFGGKEILFKELSKVFKSVSLYLNINNRTDSAVFDEDKFIYKFGNKKLVGKMNGVDFRLSPNSFFQVNFEIANKIYKQVLSEMEKLPDCHILDLFSGIGITTVMFSKIAKAVMSVECNRSSVKDQIEILKLNNSNNVNVICDRCENRVAEIAEFLSAKNSFVFVDPARNGIEKVVLNQLLDAKPKKIVYLSCNPETLAKDLKVLLNNNKYRLDFVQPYDMFPQTKHIETLVVLTKVD